METDDDDTINKIKENPKGTTKNHGKSGKSNAGFLLHLVGDASVSLLHLERHPGRGDGRDPLPSPVALGVLWNPREGPAPFPGGFGCFMEPQRDPLPSPVALGVSRSPREEPRADVRGRGVGLGSHTGFCLRVRLLFFGVPKGNDARSAAPQPRHESLTSLGTRRPSLCDPRWCQG